MIEFEGRLTGAEEKRFYQKEKSFIRICALIGISMMLSTFVLVRLPGTLAYIPWGCAVALFLLTFLPYPKKEREKMIPRKISIVDDTMTVQTNRSVESRYVDDVKSVRDYGEYYDLIFPYGKVSYSFVCQKDLLVQGTLAEFEALFEGKIERM